MELKILTTNELEQDVLNGKGAYIVSFSTSWCGPCKTVTPLLLQTENELEGKVKIAKFFLEGEGREFSLKFSIRSVPTIIFFKDGKEIDRHIGLIKKSILDDKISKLLSEEEIN